VIPQRGRPAGTSGVTHKEVVSTASPHQSAQREHSGGSQRKWPREEVSRRIHRKAQHERSPAGQSGTKERGTPGGVYSDQHTARGHRRPTHSTRVNKSGEAAYDRKTKHVRKQADTAPKEEARQDVENPKKSTD